MTLDEFENLITLMFLPKRSDPPMLIRGAYFRIRADGTLRGPDNELAASYAKDGLWELGRRTYSAFECTGPLYLRVTDTDGHRESLGPYDSLKVARGAISTHDNWLGAHAICGQLASSTDLWQEIAFLRTQESA